MRHWRTLWAVGVWASSSSNMGCSQQSSGIFEKWANTHAVRVGTSSVDTAISDLLPLEGLVDKARVVAYGEPTHGTHEPLAFRNRLFRFLVEHEGFTAIAIESGLTESEGVNRYVAGGSGDLREIVRNGFSWGFGEFGENDELIEWIRAYNASSAHSRKLRFYGIDLSGAGNGAFPYARRPIDTALAALHNRNPVVADSLHLTLSPLLDRFSSDKYGQLSSRERDQLNAGLTRLGAALAATPSSPASASAPDALSWSLQNVEVAGQLNRMLESYPPPSPNPGIPPEAFRSAAARDSGMAANVLWALQQEGAHGRLLVFAHNNHVMNSTVTGGPWSAFRIPPPAMGKFLRGALGDSLVIIGSAIGGAQDNPRSDPDTTDLDTALSQVSRSSFVLDLRLARSQPQISKWLSQPRSLRANVTDHVVVNPIPAFDAIFFIDSLTPARRMP